MSRRNDKRTRPGSETHPQAISTTSPTSGTGSLQVIRRDYDDAGTLKN